MTAEIVASSLPAARATTSALEALGITVSPFDRLDARLTASFYRHRSGLGLADRVCRALARSLSSVAFTADQASENWADDLGVAVRVIRSAGFVGRKVG